MTPIRVIRTTASASLLLALLLLASAAPGSAFVRVSPSVRAVDSKSSWKPKSGLYRGKTSQGKKISFRVSKRRRHVNALRFRYRETSSNCEGSLTSTESIGYLLIRHHRFSYTTPFLPTGLEHPFTKLSGKFKTRTKAAGKLRVTDGPWYYPVPSPCVFDTGYVKWTARKTG